MTGEMSKEFLSKNHLIIRIVVKIAYINKNIIKNKTI